MPSLIFCFVIFACLVPVIIDGVRVWEDRATVIKDSARDTANLARSVGQHAEDAFRMVEGFLVAFVDRVENDGRSSEALTRLKKFLIARQPTLPQVQLAAVFDKDGNIVVESLAKPLQINVADRDYFAFHRDNSGRDAHIGHASRDRATGSWMIPVTRRIDNPDGSFAGVVLAAVSLEYFQKYYATFDIGANGSIILISDDGTLLTRYPFDERKIGFNMRDGAIFEALRTSGPVGNLDSLSITDGIDRISSYRRIEGYPLVVAAARQKDEVLAPWRARTRSDFLGDLGLGGIIALLGALLARQAAHRAAALRAAEEAMERYQLLADNTSDLVMLIGPDRTRLYVSPACREMLGYEPEALIGSPVGGLVHPDDRGGWAAPRDISPGTEAKILQATYRVFRKDGSTLWVEAHRRPLPGDGYIVSMRDISLRVAAETALQSAKEEAEQASQVKAMFLANMSHELRTPLNAVIGFSDIIEQEAMGPIGNAKYREYAADIRSSGEHLLGLINDVLDHSKAEQGYLELDEADVGVAGLVEFAIHMLAPRAEREGVSLHAEVSAELKGLHGDERRLRQIVLNLLTNAVKFTPSGGRISIDARRTEVGDFLLTVEDTGIGISAEDQQKVLQPFVQARRDQGGRSEGTGLGLPLTKRLVELHDGTLELESSLGVGTVIRVRLPANRLIIREDASAPGLSRPDGVPANPQRISDAA